ncbi:four-carbon acid sugar kinase family protein [Leptolyngbyaceae cyanobacterium CCMR0082]|uniref:Four-carbon acid sugar kinase family protein n=2 Tax=Adonisia turfae TaxID=2950184 RepID=A0A6M0SCR2_9CYAN|nr:four-carbon acid sugar kinase family protein [Adonisia turfae]NEZ59976.1 four-carbon acid sugar kinase family protein [Adonisia turfae CCMR0081]NEZ65462.1 four-carbon acid sugar kinase family protein [Adonisia turfae CCMR0082]
MPDSRRPKIIVIDDDPTGSQTVHSCLLLLKWDVTTLKQGLLDASPIFFILANTRSLTPAEAERTTREVCQNLKQALVETNTQEYLVVSRSDSTLRGHYPLETDVIASELGPFDAHFMVPAFFEAGRITLDSTHYIETDGVRIPVHETEFAKDSVFGYSYSYLPDYVAEKTSGKIVADQVKRFTLDVIRQNTMERLMQLSNNVCVAVDAQNQADLDQFSQDLLAAAAQGKKFLFRSAASLLTSLAALPVQPAGPSEMSRYTCNHKPGVILVGSHVKKTTQQLEYLLKQPGVTGVEVDVSRLNENPDQAQDMVVEILAQVNTLYAQGTTAVVYTSRKELTFADVATRLAFGEAVSHLLMDIVRGLPTDLGFLISKGGITSNDTLSKGLALTSARLLGQVIPGVSVITAGPEHPQFPNLPVVLFPGNVGGDDAVAAAYQRMAK